MRRTQHGSSAVSPSHALLSGLRYTARRVSPSGNLSSPPSEIQVFFDSLVKLDMTYPKSGTPTSAAATPFIAAPIFKRRLRRDTDFTCVSRGGAAFLQPQSQFVSLIAE